MANGYILGRTPDYVVGRGAGGFRGLFLQAPPGTSIVGAGGGSQAVDYGTVKYDTDAIAITAPATLLGITWPIGTAGRVPTGMVGYWEISASGQIRLSTPIADNEFMNVALTVYVQGAGVFYSAQDIRANGSGGTTSALTPALVVAPIVALLAAGTFVGAYATNAHASVTAYVNAGQFLMKYLGA